MAEPARVEEAAALLRAGRLVAFPTETVYGLGADATSDRAVAAIFAAKGRPAFNPLIVHVPDRAAAEHLVLTSELAHALMARFWPGPLTLVLPRRPDCPIGLLASAGLDTLAVRAPAHELAQALLRAAGCPLAAPSANRSGRLSPTKAAHVAEELGERVALVLDGGTCRVGLESTVVDLSGPAPVLLRPGGVPAAVIEVLTGPLGTALQLGGHQARPSPGLLRSHYAPQRAVRLGAIDRQPGEAFLAFGAPPASVPDPDGQLSVSGDPVEAAARLFAELRRLDRAPFRAIAVMSIPADGLGAAINDRLARAAAPRG